MVVHTISSKHSDRVHQCHYTPNKCERKTTLPCCLEALTRANVKVLEVENLYCPLNPRTQNVLT